MNQSLISEPGRRHGFSAIALRSTSRIERPSRIPGKSGFIDGCEGGAGGGGSVDGSGPSSGRVSIMEDGAVGGAEGMGGGSGFAGAPRS